MNKKCFFNVLAFFLDMFLMMDSTNEYIKGIFLILGAISFYLAVTSYKEEK